MKQVFGVIVAICTFAALGIAQNVSQKAIAGAWQVAEIVISGNNAGTVSKPQPGLVIFGRKYFSMMYVPSDKERPIYAAAAPTNDEKVAAFDSLIANAGTYQLNGNAMIIKPTVARNPGFTGGGFATYQVRVQGKEMWLTIKNTDFNFRVGDKIVPLSGPPSETRIKLTRLE